MRVREYVTINEETAKMAKSLMSFDEYQMGSRTAEYRNDVDEVYDLAEEVIREKAMSTGKEPGGWRLDIPGTLGSITTNIRGSGACARP